jgi:site-specific DNA-methyltransferase (adenine-specific)
VTIEILHGDCMEYMATLKDKEFDLAVCDPPYGIGNFSMDKVITKINSKKVTPQERNTKYSPNYEWNKAIPDKEYFSELYRVSKEQIIWGANYYNCFSQKGGAVVWYKEQYHPNLSDCEIASLSFQKKVDYVHIQILKGFICKETLIHPCQKPVALYQWLLKNYAKQGDKILDTHLGSGSSAIACDMMGFDFVGIELDEDYYKAALDRFNRHKQQITMCF